MIKRITRNYGKGRKLMTNIADKRLELGQNKVSRIRKNRKKFSYEKLLEKGKNIR